MTAPANLDHLVYAGPDLAAAVAEVAELTGVTPVAGGRHPVGSANALVALSVAGERRRHYLEVVGPDPDRQGTAPVTAFGIDHLTEPRMVTFAARAEGESIERVIERSRQGGYDPGDPRAMSRATPGGGLLEWRLTRAMEGPVESLVPFLIDWGSTPHPGLGALPVLGLAALRGEHPDPRAARRTLAFLGVDLEVDQGTEQRLIAVLDTPKGQVTLG